MYGVNSYLNDIKFYQLLKWQEAVITECANTLNQDIKCEVPQGSVVGLLLILYVNDLPNSSNVLVSIMFADNINLFFEHINISTLFNRVNDELFKIKKWFSANSLSLNIGMAKFSLFHESGKKRKISFPLQALKINNCDT